MRLPIGAALHYAMRAEAIRWRNLDDMRIASSYPELTDNAKRALIDKINLMTSGPGTAQLWEDRLTEQERTAAQEANDERDALFELLDQRGILVDVDGNNPIESLLKRAPSRGSDTA